ncbi:hypothetical protein FACS1894171_2280 [Clostridia bacterium]|nr:hypothetical protein FACS1894171_2280 [Clostridia bacterium]
MGHAPYNSYDRYYSYDEENYRSPVQQQTDSTDGDKIVVGETRTYTNDEAGITFEYPDDWVSIELDDAWTIVMFADAPSGQYSAWIEVSAESSEYYTDDDLPAFTKEEAKAMFEGEFEEDLFTDLNITKVDTDTIDGYTVKVVTLTAVWKEDNAGLWYKYYYYIREGTLYRVEICSLASAQTWYEPILEEIMASYKINASGS